MSGEDEWTPGPDGLLERSAARVVIFDPDGRIFLIKGHDTEDTSHEWWFTVGGGLDRGEETRAGAVRELFEETGLVVEDSRLIGPVLERTAVFRFTFHERRQFEKFFLLHATTDEARQLSRWNQDNLTELELDVLDDVGWWNVDEVEHALNNGTKIFPTAIAELARTWWDGWDGDIVTVHEP